MVSFLWQYAFKDLGRNKTRSIMGIFGIAVSIFLLTTVSFATDSISNSFVDFLTTDSGNQDLVLKVRHYYGEPENRSDYFEYQDIIDQIKANVSEIQYYFPRSIFRGSLTQTALSAENATYFFQMAAMDVKLEEDAGFGTFLGLDPNLNIKEGIPVNSCIIKPNIAEMKGIQVGDEISFFINALNTNITLTVVSFFDHSLKFPTYDECDIIVDLAWFGEFANAVYDKPLEFDWRGKVNTLIMQIQGSESIYDVRDIQGTEKKITAIGANILYTIGIEAWSLEYPKLEILYYSEFLTISLNVIFMIITIVSMLISGILINGILTTSVEEKIREYGINRVLGARKSFNLKLILIQATILCFFGCTVGIVGAGLFVKYFALPLIESLLPEGIITKSIAFVAQPTSIFLSYVIGIGVGMLVSIAPALKVMRMRIVESINPYRHDDAVFELTRENTGNGKLILFGSVLAFNGLFVYLIIPQTILSLNIGLIAGVLIGTLLIFLIGVSLLAIGLMPLIIRVLNSIFSPFARKVMNIIKITIYRYQRRNLSTTVMFVLSFSFILFTTSIVEIQVRQVGALIQYQRGSDITIIPTTYDLNAPTVALQKELMQIEGIERTSALLASSYDLTRIYGGGEDGKQFEVSLGDYINFNNYEIHLYGIDRYYKDTVYSAEYIRFTEGNSLDAFDLVFNSSETNIIISTALSNALDLHLGDLARLTFTRGSEQEPVIAKVVGVASNMPGLTDIAESQFRAQGGGVIMSDENYIKYFNIPGGDMAYIDRIFIKVRSGYNADEIVQEIYDLINKRYDVFVRNTARAVQNAEEGFAVIKYLFLVILIGTVMIGLFGLISSAYSSILERRREIAITRTLGLHPSDVDKMFTIENMILLLSSATSGGIIGYITAYLLSENLTLFTESPRIIAIPWDIIGIVYGVSVLFLILGMRFLLRRVRKAKLIEIYRETM